MVLSDLIEQLQNEQALHREPGPGDLGVAKPAARSMPESVQRMPADPLMAARPPLPPPRKLR